MVVAAVAALTLVASGCATTSAETGSPVPTFAAAESVEVMCDKDLVLTVSAPAVAATSAGVAVRVTSEAPEGAYLNYGTGGDAMPSEPATWILASPPGDLTLSCSTLEKEGQPVTVTVTDPHAYWSDATLDELGCPLGGMPSWAMGGASGSTAEEAVAGLAANFNAQADGPAMTRWDRAFIGYADNPHQSWVLGTADETRMTAIVIGSGGSFESFPEAICQANPWPES